MGRKRYDDKWVRELKPKAGKRTTVADPLCERHYIRITEAGAKTFYAVARSPHGKQLWTKIEACDLLSIDESRERAREIVRRVTAGKPAIEPPRPKPEAFEAVAKDWLKREVRGVWLTADDAEWRLKKYVLPHFGAQEFTSIKRSEIAGWRNSIEDMHGRRTAELAHGLVSQICNSFAESHDDYVSPILKAKKKRRARVDDDDDDVVDSDGSRTRTLDADEVRVVWAACEADGGPWASLLQFTLLSGGQRLRKYQTMRWSDVDANGVWTVTRSSRRAKGTGGKLKLPESALAILRRQPRMASDDHVFPASRRGALIHSSNGMAKLRKRLPPMAEWSHHDVRRTFRTLSEQAGVDENVSERVLGHKLKGIKRTYNRYGYEPEKADAIQRVADLVMQIVGAEPDDNVVRIGDPKRWASEADAEAIADSVKQAQPPR